MAKELSLRGKEAVSKLLAACEAHTKVGGRAMVSVENGRFHGYAIDKEGKRVGFDARGMPGWYGSTASKEAWDFIDAVETLFGCDNALTLDDFHELIEADGSDNAALAYAMFSAYWSFSSIRDIRMDAAYEKLEEESRNLEPFGDVV